MGTSTGTSLGGGGIWYPSDLWNYVMGFQKGAKMTSFKFEVGQEVVCNSDQNAYKVIARTLEHAWTTPVYWIHSQKHGSRRGTGFCVLQHEIKSAVAKPKFKVGDKVRGVASGARYTILGTGTDRDGTVVYFAVTENGKHACSPEHLFESCSC